MGSPIVPWSWPRTQSTTAPTAPRTALTTKTERLPTATATAAPPNPARTKVKGWPVYTYSSSLRNTTQALCPPKPNELETPIEMSASRDSFGM